MICLRGKPKINARSLSRSNFADALFGRACDAEVPSGLSVCQKIALKLVRNVCELVGLWMWVPDRDHHRCEDHRTQKSGGNPGGVAIQSRDHLEGAGQSQGKFGNF